MKKTYFTEPTNMEVVLNSHQCDYIKIALSDFHEKILSGEQWIDYFRKYDEEMLDYYAVLDASDADYYDFDMIVIEDYYGKWG